MNNLQYLYETNKNFHAFVTRHLTVFEKWYASELEGVTIDDYIEADKWLTTPIGGSDHNDCDLLEYKMSALICSLSNGKISKPYVDNAVISSVITEEFEAAFDEERAQLVNDLETMKLYATKVRELFAKTYGLAYWLFGHVPVKHIPIEYAQQMDEIYRAMQELGIEVEKWQR
jgi:hypothetical protein